MCAGTRSSAPTKEESPAVHSGKAADAKDKERLDQAKAVLKQGTFYGAASVALLVGANSFMIPHRQNRLLELGCDTMCYGTFTSARSMLALIGSTLMGRISDRSSHARRMCLYVGTLGAFLGMVIAAETDSLAGAYVSAVPGSLLAQNFSIMKALFADYHDSLQLGPAERAASVGALGMAVGLAFMIGPLSAALLTKTYELACKGGIVFIILSGLLSLRIPDPVASEDAKNTSDRTEPNKKAVGGGFLAPIIAFVNIKAARSPGALILMVLRLCMSLAFHLFNTVWAPWLKETYDFGPGEFGKYLGFVGLAYALSQGLLAKRLLSLFGGNESHRARVNIILTCCVVLGVGRYFCFQTTQLLVVYAMVGVLAISLGLINTILTADTTYLAPADEIGTLFGILTAVESAAGMIGPLLAGYLSLFGDMRMPVYAVVLFYAIAFMLVLFGYERCILSKAPASTIKRTNQKAL